MSENQPDRRAIRRMLREKERKELLDALPIPVEVLKDLVFHLEKQIEVEGRACKHNTAMTEEWLTDRGIEPGPVLDWLQGVGGYCDCEVVLNVPGNYLLADLFE